MFSVTVSLLSLLFASSQAFPSQPGSCNSPQPFGNAHLNNGNFVGGTSLSSFGLEVLIGGEKLAEGEAFDLSLNTELDIELKATGGLFRGFLLKLSNGEADTRGMLVSSNDVIRDDLAACEEQSAGSLSHTNNSRKRSIKGKVMVDGEKVVTGLRLEVTVAIENDDKSEWYQSAFDLTATAPVPQDTTTTTVSPPDMTTDPTPMTTTTPATTTSEVSTSTTMPDVTTVATTTTTTTTPEATTRPATTTTTLATTKTTTTGSTPATTTSEVSTTTSVLDVTTEVTTTTSASTSTSTGGVTPGGFDDWFKFVKKNFVGKKLRRCKNRRGVAPKHGSKCGKKMSKKMSKKTCFFGKQECSTEVPSFPETRCFCSNRKRWKCKDAVCPLSPNDPIL